MSSPIIWGPSGATSLTPTVNANNFVDGYNTTVTAAGTTTLTVASTYQQYFTGTTTQTVQLPTTSIVAGTQYTIVNLSTGAVTVQSSGANTIATVPGNTQATFTALVATPTTAANWNASLLLGGGANVPTVQKFLSGSGTYTTPANVISITVEMVGGGGGGSGSGNAPGAGGTGGNTTFGTSLLVANGGVGATSGATPPTGGTASLGTGPIGIALSGGGGTGGGLNNANIQAAFAGGAGAVSPFGGGGGGGESNGSNGGAGISNTGSGGGGAGSNNGVDPNSGSGGGAGGYVKAIIANPSATYSYAVGTAGTAGTAGSSGNAGGAGGSGVIIVTEYYANGTVGTATNVTGIVAKANGGTGQATYPGDYYASVYYPGSGTNYWSNANSSIGDFTTVGTIPTPSVYVNSNFGTISKATSSLPGINFVAPRTGTIRITVTLQLQSSTSTQNMVVRLVESTTSTTLADAGYYNGSGGALSSTVITVVGYFPATLSTTYNFKIQGYTSSGTEYIDSGGTSSQLTFAMEYIN
jgi:hypothetical protein